MKEAIVKERFREFANIVAAGSVSEGWSSGSLVLRNIKLSLLHLPLALDKTHVGSFTAFMDRLKDELRTRVINIV